MLFRSVGFAVKQELVLLNHDLSGIPGRGVPSEWLLLRRARKADVLTSLVVDGLAFGPLWAMDADGLVDACHATPQHRFRVATIGSAVVGFAISGRSGKNAYLQRLAVDPSQHGRGIGRTLTLDALRWARRSRCSGMLVNTHVGNDVAVNLDRKSTRLNSSH